MADNDCLGNTISSQMISLQGKHTFDFHIYYRQRLHDDLINKVIQQFISTQRELLHSYDQQSWMET